MRSIRALTARSEADAKVQQEVANARRALQRALSVAKKARLGRQVQGRRGLSVERQLATALSQLNRVSHLTPLWDADDMDTMSEDRLAEIARERRLKEDEAKRQAEALAREEAERMAAEEERLIEQMLDEALVAERMG